MLRPQSLRSSVVLVAERSSTASPEQLKPELSTSASSKLMQIVFIDDQDYGVKVVKWLLLVAAQQAFGDQAEVRYPSFRRVYRSGSGYRERFIRRKTRCSFVYRRFTVRAGRGALGMQRRN